MKKRFIKNSTDRKIYNSLERWLLAATDEQTRQGASWYADAQEFTRTIAKRYKLDRYTVAYVLAALSPNNKWARNKADCESIISAHTLGLDPYEVPVCTYNQNKKRAIAILQKGLRLSKATPKIHAFAMNIGLLSDSHVTVDKWHIRACLTRPEEGKRLTQDKCTAAQYQRIEAITVQLARAYELKAYEAQAIIWVTIRSKWGFANA